MQKATILFALFSILSFQSLSAQTIFGTWIHQGYGITMLLQENNAYQLSFSNGVTNEEGLFTVQNNMLYLANKAGITTQYQIQSLGENALVIYDYNAKELLSFIKKGSQKKLVFEGKELAAKGEKTLNTGHVKVYTDMMAFLIGQKLSEDEEKAMQKECINSFNENPDALEQDAISLHHAMQNVYPIKNIGQIGVARLMFISEFYKNRKQLAKSQLWIILERHCKVVAFDETNNTALTQKDLDGIVSYLEFMNVEFAEGKPLSSTDKKHVTKSLISNFSALDMQQKQSICMGSLLNTMMMNNWNALSSEQKQQLKEKFKAQNEDNKSYWDNKNQVDYTDNNSKWKPNPELERLREKAKNGTLSKSELVDYKAHMKTQNMYFNMMNNMQLQNHVTSLNIIENIGGSNNYWEIKPY